ncbi:helix-turn-helix domain-containing protein [Caenimonas aquaedulcis]|uniref:Helix-turn-helix domain-containing protein n=1 Tax=Caenimonas aquaedulcis TaxID=2793270 RepID=A0A931MGX3_9BURK|nr:helix-turn-helix domain-containing protein [Caenimonas aquaedulcis]MBG9388383.1 helix-turn-helix domain-containing protein [Caenimonas aquaedulcis]
MKKSAQSQSQGQSLARKRNMWLDDPEPINRPTRTVESGPSQKKGALRPKGFPSKPRIEPANFQPSLMKYAEAARDLSISINHLRNLINDGKLRSVSVGLRGRRVARSDIEEVIRNGIRK